MDKQIACQLDVSSCDKGDYAKTLASNDQSVAPTSRVKENKNNVLLCVK